MVPETPAAFFAIAKIGAVALLIFSGYGADAVAVRLADAGAKAIVTVDGFYRRGKVVEMAKTAEQVLAGAPTVETMVVVPRVGGDFEPASDKMVPWPLLSRPNRIKPPYPTTGNPLLSPSP